VEYFNYFGSITTNNGRCTCEIKSRIAMAKAAYLEEEDSFHQQIGLKFKDQLLKCYILSTASCGAETWTLWKVYQKYLGSFEM
jgi:hypothetical protein